MQHTSTIESNLFYHQAVPPFDISQGYIYIGVLLVSLLIGTIVVLLTHIAYRLYKEYIVRYFYLFPLIIVFAIVITFIYIDGILIYKLMLGYATFSNILTFVLALFLTFVAIMHLYLWYDVYYKPSKMKYSRVRR